MAGKNEGSALGRLARILDAASRDAERARGSSASPTFHKSVREDRRGALSQYETVKDALSDRARLARAKRAKAAKAKARAKSKARPKAKAKKKAR